MCTYVWSCGWLTPHTWLGSIRPRSQCVGGMLLVQWCYKHVLNCLRRGCLRLTCVSHEQSHTTSEVSEVVACKHRPKTQTGHSTRRI